MVAQETERDGRVIAAFEMGLASLTMHTAMTGHIINGIWHLVYADMALVAVDYIWNEHYIQLEASRINVLKMGIPNPITISKLRPNTPQLVQVNDDADLTKRLVVTEYSKHSVETKKSDLGAKSLD